MSNRVLFFLMLLAMPASAVAQAAAAPYIRVGEELTYSVRSSRFGNMGTAVMRTVRDTANGRDVYRLSFDFSARIALFKVSDRTRSWIDATTLSTVRFQKCERSPIGNRDEDARITGDADGSSRTWSDKQGEHPLADTAPLDELAYIYLVRTAADAVPEAGISVNRHFDVKRNSVRLTSGGTARVPALGDTLDAAVVRMDASDPRQKSGVSHFTFYVGRDPDHLMLRIETSMPVAGNITMTLKSVNVAPTVMARRD